MYLDSFISSKNATLIQLTTRLQKMDLQTTPFTLSVITKEKHLRLSKTQTATYLVDLRLKIGIPRMEITLLTIWRFSTLWRILTMCLRPSSIVMTRRKRFTVRKVMDLHLEVLIWRYIMVAIWTTVVMCSLAVITTRPELDWSCLLEIGISRHQKLKCFRLFKINCLNV